MNQPNILFIMCDQLRFDCIHALGNEKIHTPGIDRLVRRGRTFSNAYSTCPVCIPARYTIRTGCEPYHTGCYCNETPQPMDGLPEMMSGRCGPYLAQVMRTLGYETFGIGKFHTVPEFKEDLGYDLQLNVEELWSTKTEREMDAYASFISREHPEYSHIEQLHGERTNMYYMPQMSPMPAELTSEAFVAEKAVEAIRRIHEKPYFGFVSFIGPHPPCAPPVPYNRYYNPDFMDEPEPSECAVDFMDEQIPWMNHLIWADDMNDFLCRSLKSRYYGEITYIDQCIGKLLDAVETREDCENTLICFFSDHGDHLGNHHAWQKESFFEDACHIPFLMSWPARENMWKDGLQAVDNQLICLTDLFGIATAAAGQECLRDGHPILRVLEDGEKPRESLTACYGRPGTPQFKLMVRKGPWKYIYMANGGREQLFSLDQNPGETILYNSMASDICMELRQIAQRYCHRRGLYAALDDTGGLRAFTYAARPLQRIHQFDTSSGVYDFISGQRKEIL